MAVPCGLFAFLNTTLYDLIRHLTKAMIGDRIREFRNRTFGSFQPKRIRVMTNNITEKRAVVPELVPPLGGRIEVVRVPVWLGRDWQEAINTASLRIQSDFAARMASKQFPPVAGKDTMIEAEVILVKLGRPDYFEWYRSIDAWKEINNWASQCGLKRTNPRYVFAIGEHRPRLQHELGVDRMYIVATMEFPFLDGPGVCAVWLYGLEHECVVDCL